MHKLRISLGLMASVWALSTTVPVYAAAPPAIRESVAVCDPNSPTHCAVPNSAGALPITGSITTSDASVGANNTTAPTSSTQVGSVDGSGKLQPASSTNPIPVTDVTTETNTGTTATKTTVIATNTSNGNDFANTTNWVSGSANTTGATAVQIIAAPGSGSIWITGVSCFRTDAGTTTAFVTLNDTASTVVVLPAGGGSNPVIGTPLKVAATTHLTFTVSTSLTTVYCNAQGVVQ